MRWDFIETLHCPFSGSRFSRSSEERGPDIDYGIITSEAGDFPIVNGILRLKVDEYRSPLNNLIRNHNYEQSLLTSLEMSSYSRTGAAVNFLDRTANGMGFNRLAGYLRVLRQPSYRAFTDTTDSLTRTLNRLNSKSWANWQIYRFSMPAFLSTYPLLHLMDDHGPVLDFGSGMGHAAFLMSRGVPASRITCAEHQFSLLYLARKFFVNQANFICLDGDYPLPFESSYFSSVFSSDVLHLIDSKVNLSQEFQRIVSQNGAILLPHLHNKLSPVQFGKSLTPEGYSALFEGMERRMLPEDWVVDQFIQSDSLDLGREWSPRELHDAIKGLSVVISKNSAIFHRYSGLWEKQINRIMHPIVNPLYRVSGQPGKWMLKKEEPDNTGKFSSGGDIYLPNTASLELQSLDTSAFLALKTSDLPTFSGLARKFVIIDTPERFQ
jgi:SAM-dependent methyltransferase